MTTLILELSVLFLTGVAIVLGRAYKIHKYPPKRAMGRVLRKLCLVDVDEILYYKQSLEEEWAARPGLRPILRWNQIRINSCYLSLMGSNSFRFHQVVRFEAAKIPRGKSSFEYDTRESLITDLIDEIAELRLEILRVRVDFAKRAALGRVIDQERLQTLLGKYKNLEHDMVELADMAKDKTCRDMLIERLGLKTWRILDGGGSSPQMA